MEGITVKTTETKTITYSKGNLSVELNYKKGKLRIMSIDANQRYGLTLTPKMYENLRDLMEEVSTYIEKQKR